MIVLARRPATPCLAGKACLSALRGVVREVGESEDLESGLREPYLLHGLSSPSLVFGISPLGAIFQPTALFHPQTIAGIPDSRALGAVALSAWGIALTRNHVGKEPPAGKPGQRTESKRRWEGGKGAAAGAGRPETKASWSKQAAMGWVPWLEGLAQAGLPRERADWCLLSTLLSPV